MKRSPSWWDVDPIFVLWVPVIVLVVLTTLGILQLRDYLEKQ